MRFFFIACFLFGLFTGGCSGSSGGSVTTTSSAAPAADLTGDWIGRAGALGQTVRVEASLVQNGTDITGTVRASGGCIGGGRVDGTVDGDSLRATVTAGDVVADLNLTISSADQVDGTFDLPASGACPSQQGSISLTRK